MAATKRVMAADANHGWLHARKAKTAAAIVRLWRAVYVRLRTSEKASASVAGTGFDVRPSEDDRKVYARGTIPMAIERLDLPIRAFIAKVAEVPSPIRK